MNSTAYNINILRNIILDSQHLLKKSSDSIEKIVSDICGLQYDPYPVIHLNQYIMLWNRKMDCKMDWKTKKFIVMERNIFNHDFNDCKAIDLAIEELAAFHEAKEIMVKL